jgi:hypothetical protein
MTSERDREIRRRRKRREKLGKLRAQLEAASTKADKEKIIAKIKKISPRVEVE